MEDRACGRVNVRPAHIARQPFTVFQVTMRGDALALAAFDTAGVKIIRQPAQAGFIVGKLALKMRGRVAE